MSCVEAVQKDKVRQACSSYTASHLCQPKQQESQLKFLQHKKTKCHQFMAKCHQCNFKAIKLIVSRLEFRPPLDPQQSIHEYIKKEAALLQAQCRRAKQLRSNSLRLMDKTETQPMDQEVAQYPASLTHEIRHDQHGAFLDILGSS